MPGVLAVSRGANEVLVQANHEIGQPLSRSTPRRQQLPRSGRLCQTALSPAVQPGLPSPSRPAWPTHPRPMIALVAHRAPGTPRRLGPRAVRVTTCVLQGLTPQSASGAPAVAMSPGWSTAADRLVGRAPRRTASWDEHRGGPPRGTSTAADRLVGRAHGDSVVRTGCRVVRPRLYPPYHVRPGCPGSYAPPVPPHRSSSTATSCGPPPPGLVRQASSARPRPPGLAGETTQSPKRSAVPPLGPGRGPSSGRELWRGAI